MAKVKMSDIRSGSEEVKKVFRRPMTSRIKPLKNQVFTNAELVEILDISENVEYHKDKRYFYQALIESQKGPFDDSVFGAYVNKLFHIDSMLNLLKNSTGVSEHHKLKWLEYMMVSSTHWTVFNFFSKDAGIPFGIDVTKPPYRHSYSTYIVRYMDKMGRGNPPIEYFDELHRILDTMNPDEIYDWYLDEVATSYEVKAVELLMSYDTMPEKVLQHYWDKTTLKNKEKLALHPNIPDELREWMYNETDDIKYLPDSVKAVFIF